MKSGFPPLQTSKDGVVIIFPAPSVARNPSAVRVFDFRRVGILCVVVDGANDDASRPGRDAGERGALEIAAIVARSHVFHFAGVASGNPFGKMLEFDGVGGGSDAREVEAGLVGSALDDGLQTVDLRCQPSPLRKRYGVGRTARRPA